MFAHHCTIVGFVLGEIKLAIALQLLGGVKYLDVSLFFEVSLNHTHKIFTINGGKYCGNDDEMNAVALQFFNALCEFVNCCIGAMNG